MRRIIYVSWEAMHRDMTRGSITRGLLLFALPMAAGDPCGAGLCAGGAVGVNGIWAAIPIGWSFWRTPWGYGYYFLRRRALLPEERDGWFEGIKQSGASSMN